MADFRKSGCACCQQNKGCKDAFTEFAAELCPKSKNAKSCEKGC
jgi:hypothetical protein